MFPRNIHPLTLKAITENFKFKVPTDTQTQAFNVFLNSTKDVVLQAPTGSGKSLVYLVAQIEAAARNAPSLVLVPNRELGEQVLHVAKRLLTFHEVRANALLGGHKSRLQDLEILQRHEPKILIATPGRLTHHIEQTQGFAEKLEQTEFLVIDEADFLMSQGIDNQLNKIFDVLNKKKRTALVSATVTDEVKRWSQSLFRPNPEIITVKTRTGGTIANTLKQEAVICDDAGILFALYDVLMTRTGTKTVVFFPTAQTADFTFKIFKEKLKLPVRLLHGRLQFAERTRELKYFASELKSVLFTTDLAARGIDFTDVDGVVQMHVPATLDQYVHRVGRTARAGNEGEAVIIISRNERNFLSELQRLEISVKENVFAKSASAKFSAPLQSWASSDAELIADALDTRNSLVGFFESGPGRLFKVPNARDVAHDFIRSAGFSP